MTSYSFAYIVLAQFSKPSCEKINLRVSAIFGCGDDFRTQNLQ
jgi:hypothetical protein